LVCGQAAFRQAATPVGVPFAAATHSASRAPRVHWLTTWCRSHRCHQDDWPPLLLSERAYKAGVSSCPKPPPPTLPPLITVCSSTVSRRRPLFSSLRGHRHLPSSAAPFPPEQVQDEAPDEAQLPEPSAPPLPCRSHRMSYRSTVDIRLFSEPSTKHFTSPF
jgi:hypothetical protein